VLIFFLPNTTGLFVLVTSAIAGISSASCLTVSLCLLYKNEFILGVMHIMLPNLVCVFDVI
jgi:hypothetical protein